MFGVYNNRCNTLVKYGEKMTLFLKFFFKKSVKNSEKYQGKQPLEYPKELLNKNPRLHTVRKLYMKTI
jgi:hypothetical protein